MKRIRFDEGWRFRRQGESDADFRNVRLPHDAMIGEPRTADAPSGGGGAFFTGGAYIYEKTFAVPAEWRDATVMLSFDGVYRDAVVTVNGREAGGRPYGYIPFTVDLTDFLVFDRENVVRVLVDNSEQPNSRWYSGAGIHRPVPLRVGGRIRIAPRGVRIATLAVRPARILVTTEANGGSVVLEILDGERVVATGSGPRAEIAIPDARLWSDETPHLYRCRVRLLDDGRLVDEADETFGIRTIAWSPRGLFINGKETKLRGGCVHHDNGILGARSFLESEERRVRILKSQGFNAIRSAHNPASESMLDACDRIGMYVMDETWDMWYSPKTAHDYAASFEAEWRGDAEAIVARDYNHPSVLLYSIGNENNEPIDEKGWSQARAIADAFRALDGTRPVTAGVNPTLLLLALRGHAQNQAANAAGSENREAQAIPAPSKASSMEFNRMVSMYGKRMLQASATEAADRVSAPFFASLDISGYNYATPRYVEDGTRHPDRVIVGTETYPQDIAENWALVRKLPYLVGDFMWAAWDYLGEAGIGGWSYDEEDFGFTKRYPWLLADAGAVDVLGHPGAEAFLARAVWEGRTTPAIAVRPVNHRGVTPSRSMWRGTNAVDSWSWRGCEGNPAIVEVYAKAHTVEVRLNGTTIGRKRVRRCRAAFDAGYAQGTLEAIAFDAKGLTIGRSELTSATGDLRLAVLPEMPTMRPHGILHVDIRIVGENGITESNADAKVAVTVEGGELLAFGSARPKTVERYDTGAHTTFQGRAQAVVRVGPEGRTVIRAEGNGFATASADIAIAP